MDHIVINFEIMKTAFTILLIAVFAESKVVVAIFWWAEEYIPQPTLSNLWRNTERPPFWIFDGLDDDVLPDRYKNETDVCETLYVNCIVDKTYDHPVCVWHVKWQRFIDFVSICDVDYENCRYRETLPYVRNKYGKDYTNILYEYEGDDIDCTGTPEADRLMKINFKYRRQNPQTVFEKREKAYFLPKEKRKKALKIADAAKNVTFKTDDMKIKLRRMIVDAIGFE